MSELVQALLARGHRVLWFVAPIDANRPEVARLVAAGARVERLPDPQPSFVRFAATRRGLYRWRHGYSTLGERLAAYAPDHVFLNQGGTWCGLHEDFLACLESRSDRYSLICHLNQPQPAFSPAQLDRGRKLMIGAKRVFFYSRWQRQLAEYQIAQRILNARYFQAPVRFSFEMPIPWPENDAPALAMVNRLDAFHKGIDLALGAIAVLKQEGVLMPLRIYGTGTDEPYLRTLVRYLKLDSLVEFHGYTENLEKVWARAEMLILPSRFEGLAVSMVEAMGFGRVVLRTPYGGAAEWIEDGVTGYICPAAEVELLCQTLRRALSERPRWREMGLRAHEKVRREYSVDPAAVFLEALA